MQGVVNWFVFICQQWLNSFKIFLPKNLKFFALVTINAWLQGIKSFFKYFWWLIFIILFFKTIEFHYLLQSWILFDYLPFFLMLLAVRPSVRKKNYYYYFSYSFQYILFIVTLFFITIIVIYIFKFFNASLQTFLEELIFLFYHERQFVIYSPWVILSAFFYLDSNGSVVNGIKSWWHGLKMIFYNYPFLILTMITIHFILFKILPQIPFIGVAFSIKYIGPILWLLVTWLVFAFFAALLNNFYLKRVHEDYEIYF